MIYLPKPYNTQIELVFGCNRMCDFCGIHAVWNKPEYRKIHMMPFEIAAAIANDFASWFGGKRIEFAMHGEPTLHPQLLDIISLFRKTVPGAQLQLTTNGIRLGEHVNPQDLFDAGLNILIIDTYTYQVRDRVRELIKPVRAAIYDYYTQPEFNPYHYHNDKVKAIILFGDLSEKSGKRKTRTICNHAGNSNAELLKTEFGIQPLQAPLQRKCTKPFRELIIHWNGTIPMCCLDWRHEFITAKFPEDGTIQDIWHKNKAFNAARFLLYNKNRTVVPCCRCDFDGGFRFGLIKPPTPEEAEQYSEVTARADIVEHLADYRRFAHPNAEDDFFYRPKAQGIRKLL